MSSDLFHLGITDSGGSPAFSDLSGVHSFTFTEGTGPIGLASMAGSQNGAVFGGGATNDVLQVTGDIAGFSQNMWSPLTISWVMEGTGVDGSADRYWSMNSGSGFSEFSLISGSGGTARLLIRLHDGTTQHTLVDATGTADIRDNGEQDFVLLWNPEAGTCELWIDGTRDINAAIDSTWLAAETHFPKALVPTALCLGAKTVAGANEQGCTMRTFRINDRIVPSSDWDALHAGTAIGTRLTVGGAHNSLGNDGYNVLNFGVAGGPDTDWQTETPVWFPGCMHSMARKYADAGASFTGQYGVVQASHQQDGKNQDFHEANRDSVDALYRRGTGKLAAWLNPPSSDTRVYDVVYVQPWTPDDQETILDEVNAMIAIIMDATRTGQPKPLVVMRRSPPNHNTMNNWTNPFVDTDSAAVALTAACYDAIYARLKSSASLIGYTIVQSYAGDVLKAIYDKIDNEGSFGGYTATVDLRRGSSPYTHMSNGGGRWILAQSDFCAITQQSCRDIDVPCGDFHFNINETGFNDAFRTAVVAEVNAFMGGGGMRSHQQLLVPSGY